MRCARQRGSILEAGGWRFRGEIQAPHRAGRDQLVFGAWDPIADTAYEAALRCGVLGRLVHIEPIAAELRAIEPMPAVFDQDYVRRLDGSNVKSGASKRDLARPSARTSAISRRRTPATGWS
jgi:Myo-inositol-1-phosphate synthase